MFIGLLLSQITELTESLVFRYLSTRIPEDMRNLIDDLLFILKKEAKKDFSDEPTLQDLAREAWADLLQKHKDLFARYDVGTGGDRL